MRFQAPKGVWAVVCASMLTASAPTNTYAATIPVPAGGDLQAAIDGAQEGDVIVLEPGATYVGNFVLRNKPGVTRPIVIRSAAADSDLPGPGVRMTPAHAARLPKIKSATSMPAMRTAEGAHHWTLMFLEFQANYRGYGDIIALGSGDTSQSELSQVPYALTLDRVYVHGDPELGQKRGISLNSRDTAILNSYISDCKAIGQDSQALGGYNGPGGYLIENNYLEAAGENFLIGGADPPIANLVPTDIVFRRNHLSKPLSWRNPIVAGVTSISAQPVAGGGSLPAGTYSYKVVARRMAGQTNRASSDPSVEVSATVAAGGAVSIAWSPVPGAEDYAVYGRTSAMNTYWTTTAPFFTDTGTAGTSGTVPRATKWSVKNVFELKSGQDVTVEGNVFENLWIADQPGYPIVITPRNQNGRAPWTVVQRVTFRYNVVRHTAGGVNILGTDNLQPTLRTNNIVIAHNVFEDMTAATWGAGSRFLTLGDGPASVTVDHNTVITTNTGIVSFYGGSTSSPTPIPDLKFTNNMSRHNRYGIMASGFSIGMSSITAYVPDGEITHNVLAGGSASLYPAPNYFPATTAWEETFVDYAGGDYRLADSSVFKNAGSDGTDLGADIERIRAETANALTGDNSMPPGTDRIQVLTTTLPNAALGQPYAEALACTGGSGSCIWALRDGSLQDGLTLDPLAGVISGVPSLAGQRTFTVEAGDAEWPANTAARTLTLSVDPPPFTISVPEPAPGRVGLSYSLTPSVSGAVGAVSWSVVNGALPIGLWLDAASGTIAGVPSAWGSVAFVLRATDSWSADRAADATIGLTIAPLPLEVASTSLGSTVQSAAFAATLTATGGTGSVVWTLAGGSLPAGVTLDAGGLVSGTPSESGMFVFTARAADANWSAYSADGTFTLTVDPPIVVPPNPEPEPGPEPEAPSALDIVLHARSATVIAGSWQRVADATAAGGFRLWNPDAGAAKPPAPLAAPGSYFELSFTAEANLPYHLWIRGKADRNYWGNDSVFVQFSHSVDASGGEIYRIGSTSGATISVEDGLNAGVAGWGWNDNAYSGLGAPIVFGAAGPQTLRIQQREDGISIDQIVLSPVTYFSTPPGAAKNDATLLPSTEIVLYTADATVVAGAWSQVADANAAGGYRLWNPDARAARVTTPLADPVDYFELTFEAAAGVPYHFWLRGRADRNLWSNDSVFVQFSSAVNADGAAVYRIGTTSATTVTVEDALNAGLRGWGWQDNAFDALAQPVVFAESGPQTIRVQVREDGLSIDQVVLSAATYATKAPGDLKNDATILIK